MIKKAMSKMTARGRRLMLGWAGFALIELLLIVFVDKPFSQTMRQLDKNSPQVVDFFRVITDAGLGLWYLWPSGLGLLLCISLAYNKRFVAEARARMRKWAWALACVFLSVSISGILTDLIKPAMGRARPKLLASEDVYGFSPFEGGSDFASLPSGHTTTVFALAAVLMAFFPRWRWPFLACAAMIAVSRVVVNAHYLSDVLAGAAVGWFTAVAVVEWMRRGGRVTLPVPKG